MAEVIRNLQKRGAKNKIINDSVKDVMALIMRKREEKKIQDEADRLAKYGPIPGKEIVIAATLDESLTPLVTTETPAS